MNSLLFRAAHDHNVGHVIFFSCTVMYPSSDTALRETDFDANTELHPRYFGVGWTKVYVEKMCEFYASLGRTKYTALRHSNIYGPHDKFDLEHSHVFGATITKTMTSADGRIVVWGEGTESRDLLFADDLTNAVECAIQNQTSDFALYNIGYGEAVTIRDLVGKIVSTSGRDLTIEHDLTQPTIPTSLFVDCTRAQKEIGWQQQTSLDDGIARTIAWWRDNIDPDTVVPKATDE
jgi:GDP-L-fucose synthase